MYWLNVQTLCLSLCFLYVQDLCDNKHFWIELKLRPEQNGCHFAEVLLQISLKFLPKWPTENKPALVQVMGWGTQATTHHLCQWWLYIDLWVTRPQWVKTYHWHSSKKTNPCTKPQIYQKLAINQPIITQEAFKEYESLPHLVWGEWNSLSKATQ